MLKNNYRKIGKKNDNGVDTDVTQLECNNNKCYALVFRYTYTYTYIYIYIYIYIYRLVSDLRVACDNFLGKILF